MHIPALRRPAVVGAVIALIAVLLVVPLKSGASAPATKLVFTTQPGNSTGGIALSTQPVVKLEDGSNNVVTTSGVSVTLSLLNANGAILSCPSVTTVSGVATFANCSVNLKGSGYQLQASANVGGAITGTSTVFSISVGPVSQLVFVQDGSPISAGATFSIAPALGVADAGGNLETSGADSTDAIILATQGGNSDPLTCSGGETSVGNAGGYLQNAVAGVATFSQCTIRNTLSTNSATFVGVAKTAVSAYLNATGTPFTISPAALGSIGMANQPSSSAQGAIFASQPQVVLKDVYGNVETGISSGNVTLALSPGAQGSLTCSSAPITSGMATFTGCAVTATNTAITLIATYVDPSTTQSYTVASSPITIGAAQPTSLAFQVQPSGATAGSVFTTQPVVTISGGSGVVANGAVTLSVASGPGTLACTLNTVSSVNGTATFSGCALSLSGAYVLQASLMVGGTTITTQSTSFSVGVGQAAKLAIATPAVVAAGQSQPGAIMVTVQDAAGETVTTASGTVTLTLRPGTGNAGAVLSCAALNVSVVNGVASFSACSVSKSGSGYQLAASFSSPNLSANSASFNVSAGPAVGLSFSAVPNSVSQGSPFGVQPVVKVVDASGTTTASNVTITLSSSGAGLSCNSLTVTAVSGVATFSGCQVSTATPFTLTASSNSLNGANSTTISVVATLVYPSAPVGVPSPQTWGQSLWAHSGAHTVDDVTSVSGQLDWTVTDLKVASLGPAFVLQRTYNSADSSTGLFGIGWSSPLDVSVSITGSNATVRAPDGQRLVFRSSGSGQWLGPPGAQVSLTCTASANVCQITTRDQVTYTVVGGRLNSVLNAQGYGWHIMWNSTGLASINLDTAAGPLVLAVSLTPGGEIASITTPSGRQTAYSYLANYLSAFQNPLGGMWTYSYSAGLLGSVTSPDGTFLQVSWSGQKVASAVMTNATQRFSDTYSYSSGATTRFAQVNTGSGVVPEAWVDNFQNQVLISTQSPSGALWGYQYDAQLNQVGLVSPVGDQWVSTFNAAGDLTSYKVIPRSGSAQTTQYNWNNQHQMLSRTDPTGLVTKWTYSGSLLASQVGPSGLNATSYTYDRYGELVSASAGGTVTSYSYSPTGERVGDVVTVNGQSRNGYGPSQSYDEAGNVLSTTTPDGHGPGGNNPDDTTLSTYDAMGDLLSVTNASGTKTNTYSLSGRLLATTQAGVTTTTTWNDGAGTCVVANGVTSSTSTYDPSGSLISYETNRVGGSYVNTLTPDGLVATTTNAATGFTTTNGYDGDGRLIARSDSANDSGTWQWNASNQLTSSTVNGVTSTTSYDLAGRTLGLGGPTGSTSLTYGANGLLATRSSSLGTTSYRYDALGDLTGVSDSSGLSASYGYDGDGHVTSVTVDGITTNYGYDASGLMVSKTDALGRTTNYTYTAAGNLASTSSSGGGATGASSSFSYNAAGQLIGVVDAAGTHSYTYGSDGQLQTASLSSSDSALSGTFSYANTTAGQLAETYPDGTVAQTTYGPDGMPIQVSVLANASASAPDALWAYQRNPYGRVIAQAAANGTLALTSDLIPGQVGTVSLQCGSTNELTYAASYNAQKQLSSQSIFSPQGSPSHVNTLSATTPSLYGDPTSLGSLAATGSASLTPSPACGAGSISPVNMPASNDGSDLATQNSSVPAPTWSMQPAPVGATPYLTNIANTTRTYNVAGDLTAVGASSSVAVTGHPSELATVAGEQVTYNAAGDVTQIVGSGLTRSFTYNAADQLISVSWSGSSSGSANLVTDFQGHIVGVTQGGTTTSYLYDPRNETLAEVFSGSTESQRYIYGQGLGVIQTANGATYYVNNDGQGLPIAETDASGNLAAAQIQGGGLQGSVVFGSTSQALPATWLHGLFSLGSANLIFTSAGPVDIVTGRLLNAKSSMPNSQVLLSPYRSADTTVGSIDPMVPAFNDAVQQAVGAFSSYTPPSSPSGNTPQTPQGPNAFTPALGSPDVPNGPSSLPLLEPAAQVLQRPAGLTATLSVLARSSMSPLAYGTMLANVYKLQFDDVVRQMVSVGYNLDAISTVLNKVFHFTPTALGEYLIGDSPYTESGFTSTPNEIATAISNTYPS